MIEDLVMQHVDTEEVHGHIRKRTVFAGRTALQEFEIAELGGYGKALLLNGCIQSTEHDECIYHEAIVFPAHAYSPGVRSVLCIGGGNGGLLKQVLKLPRLERVELIDIDPELHSISRRHLGHMHADTLSDPRVSVDFGDPFTVVCGFATADDTMGAFDLIIADLPDSTIDCYAPALFTVEFYRAVSRLLSPGGIFVTQAGPAHFRNCRFLSRVLRSLGAVFHHAIPYSVVIPSYGVPWAFALAANDVNLAAVDGSTLAQRINEVDHALLSSYDYSTHVHMFNLPRTLREALSHSVPAITLEQPEVMKIAAASPDSVPTER